MVAGNGHNGPKGALAMLFASSARAAILRLFMLDPSRAYYQRQIEAATGLAIRAVQRELERLAAMGLVYRRAEGNRTYYQVDVQFPLFPELRSMVLKTASEPERIRGQMAVDDAVRLAFLSGEESRLLVVTEGDRHPSLSVPEPYQILTMRSDEFTKALAEKAASLESFLARGVDLLGRREDVLWRRIEAAGYHVEKGRGVA